MFATQEARINNMIKAYGDLVGGWHSVAVRVAFNTAIFVVAILGITEMMPSSTLAWTLGGIAAGKLLCETWIHIGNKKCEAMVLGLISITVLVIAILGHHGHLSGYEMGLYSLIFPWAAVPIVLCVMSRRAYIASQTSQAYKDSQRDAKLVLRALR